MKRNRFTLFYVSLFPWGYWFLLVEMIYNVLPLRLSSQGVQKVHSGCCLETSHAGRCLHDGNQPVLKSGLNLLPLWLSKGIKKMSLMPIKRVSIAVTLSVDTKKNLRKWPSGFETYYQISKERCWSLSLTEFRKQLCYFTFPLFTNVTGKISQHSCQNYTGLLVTQVG